MELDLIDCDRDLGDVIGTAQLIGAEVRDANVANQSAVVEFRHRLERLSQRDRGLGQWMRYRSR